jgi:predicted PurR-regulated permease PerM
VSDPAGADEEGADSRFYARVFALVTAAILGYALVGILRPFVGPILWALLLAFLLFPLNTALRRRRGERRAAAAGVLTLIVIVVLIGPALLLGVAFANQAGDLFRRLQAMAGQYQIGRPSDLLRVPLVEHVILWVESIAPVSAEQLHGWLVTAASTALAWAVATSGSFVVGALGTLVSLVLMLFLLFFFLRDGEAMAEVAIGLVPLSPARRAHLREHLSAVTRAVVFGALLTALIQGLLTGLGFMFVRLPSPVVFGAVAAGASLIPFVGTALVWVPGAAALAVQQRWGAALFLVVWSVAVVSSADNFIRPLFISGRAQISTLPVVIGLAGGLSAFGPIGLVLGPLVVALALALLRFAQEAREGA